MYSPKIEKNYVLQIYERYMHYKYDRNDFLVKYIEKCNTRFLKFMGLILLTWWEN